MNDSRPTQTSQTGADYYAANYPDYSKQNPPHKMEFYMRLLRRWVPRGERIFELGLGLGVFLERAAHEYTCSGSEINAYGIEQARARIPGATLYQGSCERIPSDPPPSAVVAWDVLEHLPDPDDALHLIHDRLRSNGILIGVVPVYDGPLGWLVERLDHDPTHVSKLGRWEWLAKLKQHGFHPVDFGGIVRRLLFGRWYLHVTRPRWMLRPMGSALYFVAKKT